LAARRERYLQRRLVLEGRRDQALLLLRDQRQRLSIDLIISTLGVVIRATPGIIPGRGELVGAAVQPGTEA